MTAVTVERDRLVAVVQEYVDAALTVVAAPNASTFTAALERRQTAYAEYLNLLFGPEL